MKQKQKISPLELATLLLDKRVLIIKVVVIFLAFGVLIAYTTPEEWSSRTELMPELQSESVTGGGSSLKTLAGLAGVKLGSESGGTLNPLLYPQIINSFVFKSELLDKSFYFTSLSDTLTLRQYMLDHTKSSLIQKVMRLPAAGLGSMMKWIKGEKGEIEAASNNQTSELFFYTKDEKSMFEEIERRLTVTIDENTGVVKISAMFQDRVASALIVKYTHEYLTNFISEYNSEKEVNTLTFLSNQLKKSEEEYKEKQSELATYIDGNRNITTETANIKRAQLQREVDLAFNLYSTLAQQVQEKEVSVEEKKAVFTLLKPASVSPVRSKPKRFSIIVLSILLGTILTSGLIIYKHISQ